MKKTLAIILCLLLALMPLSVSAATNFTDVKTDDWFYTAVDYAIKNNIFTGTGNNIFSPNKTMTRGMFATVLGRKSNVPLEYGSNKTTPFNDVTQADYFFPHVVWANDHDIISGVGDRKFDPTAPVKREQIATILFRYAEKTGNDTTYSDIKFSSFSDKNDVSDYAIIAMKWATTHDVLKGGSDGKLAPKGNATRAQVAQIFFNVKDLLTKTEIIDDPPITDPDDTETPDPDDWQNYNPNYQRRTGKSEADAQGGYYDYDLANEVMDLINNMRADIGLNDVLYHPQIEEWAFIRSDEFKYWWGLYGSDLTAEVAHSRPADGSGFRTVGYFLSAENLSGRWGFSRDILANEIAMGWYNSPLHRQAMLNSLRRIGAVSCYVIDGKTFSSYLFSDKTLYIFDLAE